MIKELGEVDYKLALEILLISFIQSRVAKEHSVLGTISGAENKMMMKKTISTPGKPTVPEDYAVIPHYWGGTDSRTHLGCQNPHIHRICIKPRYILSVYFKLTLD